MKAAKTIYWDWWSLQKLTPRFSFQ